MSAENTDRPEADAPGTGAQTSTRDEGSAPEAADDEAAQEAADDEAAQEAADEEAAEDAAEDEEAADGEVTEEAGDEVEAEAPPVDDPAVLPEDDVEDRDAEPAPAASPASEGRDHDARSAPARAEADEPTEPVTEAVALGTTTAATTADAAADDAAVEVDPVLVAAATSTKVTWGSMIVDVLYSIGIRSKLMGTDWLAIPVSKTTETRWLVTRSRIYRNVVIPRPGSSSPKPLWETNFSSLEEALRYWGLQTGRWGQSAGENQYYTDGDNVYIDADGNLVIEARREAAPDGLGAPYNYTSARVVTMGKQSIGVGTRVVARIQMPVTEGVLPAFWSVGLEPGHEYDWPRQGEIDIVEVPGMGTPESRTTWTGNIHGPAQTNNTVDVKLHGVDADLGVDLSQGFHDYGMDWYSDRIVWHVDGVEVGRVTKAEYEALGGDWTPFSGAWDHYLILNVAVGNPWTGDPDPTAPFQAQMKVDWVKAYAL
ncbi:glycoside hydrolase family 16 protein [Mycobacterium sp. NAZ190054]|uniref:glycoside hydrolase family 16 protein n=1 Tax=Mycobacterium sp. NAZ190054 TaxID=1747766 RepID=UPI001E2B716C|nr:glycoside hydrolase family 16 protein [Mycobacterium sp. NAZ190054]